jgi:single-strand DNA-binding protein
MADDRMKNDDLRNMKGEDQDFGKGQQSPGRNPQGGQQQGGQHGGQQQGGQYGGGQQGGQQGGQRKPMNEDDEAEFGGGTTGQRGQSRGGQNR